MYDEFWRRRGWKRGRLNCYGMHLGTVALSEEEGKVCVAGISAMVLKQMK
jgi:hypothetical protein